MTAPTSGRHRPRAGETSGCTIPRAYPGFFETLDRSARDARPVGHTVRRGPATGPADGPRSGRRPRRMTPLHERRGRTMRTMAAERPTEAAPVADPSATPRGTSHWVLSAIFLGIPAWWALGLMAAVPIAMSVVMARDLLRRKDKVVLPEGFLLWALFLAWVALGVFVLWADAPSAVPGGGPSRLLVFGLRAAWYFAGTMVLLWVLSRTEDELPTRWVFDLVAALFVLTTAGGLLGLLAPTFEFRSLVEFVLPAGLRNNNLVSSLIHPAAAEIQSVLGSPAPRPQAPFAFANTWGSVMGLSLPFFLVAWVKNGRTWQRALAPIVLLASAFPIIYSLNRGLWVCVAMGAVGLVVLQLCKRRVVPFVATVATLARSRARTGGEPSREHLRAALDNQHSNDRRSELASETVSSVGTGSPVVGFGSTRDVQGNFASIAGGATADCSSCGVPSLGTQGQLWLVIFSQGLHRNVVVRLVLRRSGPQVLAMSHAGRDGLHVRARVLRLADLGLRHLEPLLRRGDALGRLWWHGSTSSSVGRRRRRRATDAWLRRARGRPVRRAPRRWGRGPGRRLVADEAEHLHGVRLRASRSGAGRARTRPPPTRTSNGRRSRPTTSRWTPRRRW